MTLAASIGALGVSGDTSCADHNIAWRVRQKLGMDKVPAGVTTKNNDAIIYDIGKDGKSASGFGHPKCGGKEPEIAKQIGASAPVPPRLRTRRRHLPRTGRTPGLNSTPTLPTSGLKTP